MFRNVAIGRLLVVQEIALYPSSYEWPWLNPMVHKRKTKAALRHEHRMGTWEEEEKKPKDECDRMYYMHV